jgi:hypothetical protein
MLLRKQNAVIFAVDLAFCSVAGDISCAVVVWEVGGMRMWRLLGGGACDVGAKISSLCLQDT